LLRQSDARNPSQILFCSSTSTYVNMSPEKLFSVSFFPSVIQLMVDVLEDSIIAVKRMKKIRYLIWMDLCLSCYGAIIQNMNNNFVVYTHPVHIREALILLAPTIISEESLISRHSHKCQYFILFFIIYKG
jgi:hypothetical protein